MKPIWFGIAPILMMRFDGGLRIIYPDGRIHWDAFNSADNFSRYGDMYACTQGASQQASYENCVRYDRNMSDPERIYSKFLGYL